MEDRPFIPEHVTQMEQESPPVNQVLQVGWRRALETDEYEVAAETLGDIMDFRNWRQAASRSPFPQFYALIEGATLVNKAGSSQGERDKVVAQLIDRSRSLSPRARDLYFSLLSDIDESSYTPQFDMTQQQHDALRRSGDIDVLSDPSVPWEVKLNRMKTRIEYELRGRKALDRREKEMNEAGEGGRERTDQNTPPQLSNESKPGMDEMDRLKEGEIAPAIWTIDPAYGGYFKEQVFDMWDSQTNTWKREKEQYQSIGYTMMVRQAEKTDLRLTVQLQSGIPVRVPVPYSHRVISSYGDMIHPAVGCGYDKNGDYVLYPISQADDMTRIDTTVVLEKRDWREPLGAADVIPMDATLTEETEQAIQEIGRSRHGNLQKARALASYTMRRLEYSNDSSYNSLYEGHPDGYIGAIDRFKKADCDVANTYFAALCSRLTIPARHVVGHMVKGKDADGNSRITSGTGHAWSEVWDGGHWVRIDATPPGDSQLEDRQEGDAVPGDYGEWEAIGPTDEELQKLHQKLSQVTEELSYTPEERTMSEAAGVELKEARTIIKEIQEAENTRLPSGERVVDVLAGMWSLIRQSRMVKTPDYTGPLRKREGGESIEDIVAHKIGIKAGESDPASRQKEDERIATEEIIHSMQVLLVGDKSASMNNTVDAETKLAIQRRTQYLLLSSLYRAEINMQKAANRMHDSLGIESQVISFRSRKTIDVDKPLSATFSLTDKVKLWKSLGNKGYGNGDIAALTYYRDQIKEEREEKERQGKEDDALRIIIACSDGMPDDAAAVHRLAGELGGMNTVTVGIGMTETASQVPIIFDTPHSRGDFVRDIDDLPVVVAKHIVTEAIRLFPAKKKKQYQKSIDAILAKFSGIGVQ